jgi:lysosomal Pro-X carboxypeptidase
VYPWLGRDCVCAPVVVFTNGKYDPWSSVGVTESLSNSLPAIFMEEAAHHLDLYFSNPADPPSVIAARKFQMNSISDWLSARQQARVAAATTHLDV